MPKRLVSFKDRFAKPVMAAAMLATLFGSAPTMANPSGGTVQAGNVNIQTVGPSSMQIEQLTQKAIIDWQRFGIGQGESVQFLQPNQLSVILNRVTGQDPSQILGNLSANGNVFLINPNGILFGPSAVVNVGGLVASTLNISNEDFLNGNFRFTQDANKALASVVNQGTINITDGGYAVLMAPLVSNEGLIVANLGKVSLMSGESATLNFDGRNLINYSLGPMSTADPGTVVVDRETVSSLLAGVIRDNNLTEAGDIVENPDGAVSLVGASGTVVNNGTIRANGAAGQEAGKVVLDSGRLTVLGPDGVIQANGEGKDSNGGEVLALSQGTLKFSEGSTLEARGSSEGGDGGFIETSGLGRIILEDYADAGASNGERGQWLIDPTNLTIIDGASSSGDLDGYTDTSGQGGTDSTISVGYLEGITGTDVTLQADNQITIDNLGGDQTIDFQDGVNVTFQTTTGDVIFTDPNDTVRVGGTGSLTMDSGGSITLGKLLAEDSANIDLTAVSDIKAAVDGSDDITTGTGLASVDSGGNFQADVSGNLQINDVQGDATLRNNNGLVLNSNGPGTVAGDFNLDNDAVFELGGSSFVGLTVTGDVEILNSSIAGDLSDAQTDLVANSLTVTADSVDTTLLLETDIADSITVNDLVADGGGDADAIFIYNDGLLNSVTLNSDSSDSVVVSTDGIFGRLTLSNGSVGTSFSGPQISTVTVSEHTDNITGSPTFTQSADVTLEATAGSIILSPNAEAVGSLTLLADGAIYMADITVDETFTLVSQNGTIGFSFAGTAGAPGSLVVESVAGKAVSGSWDSDQSTLTYDDATDRLLLTDKGAANTNVSFEVGTGDINIDFADVGDFASGDQNDLTLIAAAGNILDEGDPGTSDATSYGTNVTDPDLDIRGGAVTLVAGGSIGNSSAPLELEIGDSIAASSGSDTFLEVLTTSAVSVAGMTVGGDLELTTAGDLTVDENILAGGDIHLDVNGDITLIGQISTTAVDAVGDTTPDVIIETDINSGGSIFDGNGDAISTGMNIDAGVGGDLFFYTRGGIGSDSSGDNEDSLEIDAETVAFLNRAGDVNLHDLDSDGDGLRVIKNSITGVTFTLAAANDDICLLTDTGDLTLSANTDAGGNIALDAGGAVNLNKKITSGGSVGIQARGGAIVDGRGSGINISGSTDVALVAAGSIGTSTDSLRIDADTLAVQATGEVNIEDATGDLEIVSFSTGASPLKSGDGVSGVTATGDVQLTTVGDLTVGENIVSGGDLAIYAGGNIQLGDTTGTTRGVLVAGVGADGAIGGMDDATATVSLEAGGDITDGNGDSTADGDADGFADGANIIALGNGSTDTGGNVVLNAASAGKDDPIEIDTLVVAASTSYENLKLSEQDLVTGDGLTVGELVTTLGAETVTGLTSAGGGLSIGLVVAAGDLRVNEDINGGAGSVYLSAAGDITVGDDPAAVGTDADQVLGGAYVVLDAGNDIIDNNGVGNFAVNALDVGLRAGGSVGSVQFDAGSAASGTAFELGNNSILAAEVGEDLNVSKESPLLVDFSLDYEDLTGASYNLTGITAGQDVCLATTSNVDVSAPIVSTGGSVGLQAGSDIVINADVSAADTISLETAAEIANPLGDLTAPNVVLDAATGIGTSSKPLQVKASNLAAENSTSGDIHIDAGNPTGSDVTVSELSALKSGNTITGVSGAEDVNIAVDTDNLQVSDDVTSQSGTVYLKAGGNITVGDDAAAVGTDADQITGPGKVILEAGGDIVDNNGAGNVAIDAGPGTTDGKIGLVAGGSVGDVQFNAGAAASGSAFEIGGIAVGAQVTGEINISTADSYVSSTQVAYTDSTGATVYLNGLNAGEDLCLDATNGIVNLSMGLASTNGSVAVRAASNVVLSYGGITAADTISVESGGEILDGSGGSQSLTAPNVVLDAAHGIGDGFHVLEVNAANLAAANSTDGNIKIEATNPSGSDLTVTELSTLKSGNTITGVSGAEDVNILVDTDNLQVSDDVSSQSGTVYLKAGGNITVGDDASAMGTDADQITGPGKVILEAGGDIVDNNGAGNVAIDAGPGTTDGKIGLVAGGSVGDVQFNAGAAATGSAFEIGGIAVGAQVTGEINISTADSYVSSTQVAYTDSTGATVYLNGLNAGEDLCLDATNGIVNLSMGLASTNGSVAVRAASNVVLSYGGITAADTISVESGGEILDGSGGSQSLTAPNVVLDAAHGIGDGTHVLEVNAANLAAANSTDGNIKIEATNPSGSDLTITELSTLKSGNTITGVSGAEDVNILVDTDNLQVSDDVVGGTAGAASEVALKADGNITIGDGADGQVRNDNADSGNRISLFSSNGDIVDNNGDGAAAVDANGGDVVFKAAKGNIGTTDFAGTATTFEIDAARLAADSNDDINVLDLDTNADGLEVTSLDLANGDGTIKGLVAFHDICLDVVNGDLNVESTIEGEDYSGVALRTQDADGVGEDGDINLNAAVKAGKLDPLGTVSLESASQIEVIGSHDVSGLDVVLSAEDGIATNGTALSVDANRLAAQTTNGGDINIKSSSYGKFDVSVSELETLKGGTTVTGVSSAGDVFIVVGSGDGLKIDEDVVAGTAGVASEIALKAADSITIGDGANGEVRNAAADSGNRVSLIATNGDIVDNNGDGVAAVDANGGDLVVKAAKGSIGTTDFAGTATTFETDAARLAATSGDDVNIVDLDSNGDGLDITTLTLANAGGDVSGVTAANDICLDVVNGAINIDQPITSTSGSVALRTQDADGNDDADIVLNGVDVSASAAGKTVSLNSANEIIDTDSTSGSLIADNVVLLADTGIGNSSEVNLDTTNIAAQSITSGNVNLSDGTISNTKAGFTQADLSTLKSGTLVSGIDSAADICLDLTGDIVIDENIVSRGNLAIRTTGDLQLGDTSGTTRGVLVAGVGADGAVGGDDDVTATVSVEAGGAITDGNGDDTTDGDGDGYADGANIIALGGGTVTGGNIVITGDSIGDKDPIETDALVLAASSDDGNLRVAEQDLVTGDGLTIGELTTKYGGTTVTGLSTNTSLLSVEVAGGDLRVNEDIAGNVTVFLSAAGDITVGDDPTAVGTDADQIDGSNSVALFAGNDIVDNNGTGNVAVRSAQVGLVAGGSVGDVQFNAGAAASGSAFEIEADTLAADVTGALNVFDSKSVATGPVTYYDSSGAAQPLDAVTAGQDLCLEAAGDVQINSAVTSTNESVAVKASGDIALDGSVSAADTISAEAGQKVLSNSSGSLTATNVVLDAAQDIGDSSNAIQVNASNLAARNTTSGDISIEGTNPTGSEVTIAELSTLKGGNTISGVSGTEDVNLVIDTDGLQVHQDVTSAGGDVALSVGGDLTIGNGSGGTTASDTESVSANGTVSLEAASIVDANGAGGPASVAADTLVIDTSNGVGSSADNLTVDVDTLAARVGSPGLYVQDVSGDLTIGSATTLVGGVTRTGVASSGSTYLDVLAGDLILDEAVFGSTAKVALRAAGDIDFHNESSRIYAGSKVSLESVNGGITNTLHDGTADVLLLGTYGDLVISVDDSVGSAAAPLEVQKDGKLAVKANGDVFVEDITATPTADLVISKLTLEQSGGSVSGISAGGDVSVTTGLGLGLDADVVGGTAGGASEVALKADGDITIGDGANGQVRNATADSGNRVSLFSSNGSIVDNNGDGVAAVDANGGDVVASASNGSIGTTDFAGTSSAFEIDAARLAATSGDDVNIVDLDTNGDGLHISQLALANGGGDVTGIFAPNDICLDVVNGDLTLDESVLIDNPTGRIALRTQDLDGAGEVGDILLDGGSVNGTAGPAATVSIESAGTINSNGAANVAGDNTVLTSADGIGTNGHPLQVIGDNLAASSVASGDINMTVETDSPFGTVRIEELTTLKGGATVSGVSAAEDVGIEVVSGNNLQLKADVVGGAAGVASGVALKADGDITIGDGANGQVRNATADSGNRVSLFSSNGDIIDNNGDGVAAVDANGGDVVASASNGSIGTTDFAGTSSAFEIDAARLAATSGDDINVLDLDTKADGLSITTLALANGGGDVTGLTAANDICIDVVNGAINVDQPITSTSGSVALRTQDADGNDDADIVLNGADVTASAAGKTVSMNSANQIVDTDSTSGSVIADNVVLLADSGIGNTSEVNLDASNIAAQSITSGNVNLSDGTISDTKAGFTQADLYTLKTHTLVSGISSAADICLDLAGDFVANENIVSSGNLAIRASGDIQLGDTTGTTRGVLVAGVGADGAIGGGDDVTATVSLEAGGSITDGNGDSSSDGDGDGFADGANIIALGNGTTNTGGNVVLKAGGDIGGPGDSIETDTLVVAASADSYVNLSEQDLASGDGLTVGELTTTKGGTTVTGITLSSGETDIDVTGGDLRIHEDVSGGSVANLSAIGDIIVGDDPTAVGTDADQVIAGTSVSLSAGGAITDNNGDGAAAVVATGGDVVAKTFHGSIGTTDFAGTETPFEIDAARLAADSAADINIVDLDSNGDGLDITTLALANGGGDVKGVTAANDVCLDVVNGDLNLLQGVLSNNGSVALRTQDADGTGEGGDINLKGNVSAGGGGPVGDLSLESAGQIEALDDIFVSGVNVALSSEDGIGTNGIDFVVDATNLAAQSTTSGDVDMVAASFLENAVTVAELKTLKGGKTVTGVSAAENVGLTVDGDGLQLKAEVVGGTAGAASEVALKADGDITIGDGANGQVRNAGADSGNRVSLFSSNGSIVDNNGDGAAAVDASGGDVVASASNGSIGTTDFAGTSSAFEIDAARLAATSGDDINVLDLDTKADGLSITTLALANGGGDVVGVTAANDVCLDVVGGNLDVDQVIAASGGAVALHTRSGDINLNGFEVTANTTASLESAGEIKDTVQGTGSVVAPNVVMDARNAIGETAAIEVQADNLAAVTRTAGSVNVTDGSGDLTVANSLTTLKGGNSVDGVTAANDVCIDTVGALQVSADVTSTAGDVALRSQGGNTTVEGGVTVKASAGKVSVEAFKDIVDNNGAGKAALVAGSNAVLSAGGDIKGTAGALEIEAQGLAAKAGGTLMVDDLSGDLRIVEDSTLKTATALDGVTAGGMVCIETKAGSLDVANQIASDDAVALKAAGNIDLSGADNITVNDGGQETASLEAGKEISNSGDGIVDANKVVLQAGSGIGATDPVEIEADDFSADGGTGRVNVKDVAGGLRVTTLDTLKGGDTVAGATAAQDVCLDVVGGDLTIDENINAGTLAALKADGDIVSNATTTAANKVSVESTGGAIVDGNGDGNNFVADQIGLKADGNIGSKTDAIDIDSNVVAAKSVTGELNLRETSGDMNLGDVDLAKGGGTLNNLSVATDISLIADDGTVKYTGLTIEAPHEIAIRTRDTLVTDGVLKTNPDGRVSIEVTDGGIQDPTLHDLDIQTGDVVLKAQGDIGGLFNPLNIDANRLAAQSKTGRVNVEEKDGLVVTNLDLSLGGGAVNGISAAQDVDLVVNNGDLDLGSVAGKNVRVTVNKGNITDGNGPANNITAANDVRVEASGDVGKDDPLEITAGGKVVVISQSTRSEVTENSNTVSTPFVPYSLLLEVIPNFVLPPGVFAQDNVKLGEKGFYLDVLYGYLTPEQIQLIIDRLEK